MSEGRLRETDTYVMPEKKSELKQTVELLIGTLLLQAVLFYISPAISECGTMLICFLFRIDLSGESVLLVLDLCDLVMYCVSFVAPALLFVRLRRGRLRDFARFRARVPEKPVTAVLAAMGAITLAGYVSNIAVNAFDAFGAGIYTAEGAFPVGIPAILIYFVSSVVAPAFIEELAYRGVVLNALLPYGRCFAVVASGVLFGVMHFNPAQLIYATIAGCVLGYFVSECGSIWIGIGIHMLNNAISFLSFFLYDNVDYEIYYRFIVLLDAAVASAGIAAAVIMLARFARAPDPRRTPPQSMREELAAFATPVTAIYAIAAAFLTLRWFYLY